MRYWIESQQSLQYMGMDIFYASLTWWKEETMYLEQEPVEEKGSFIWGSDPNEPFVPQSSN